MPLLSQTIPRPRVLRRFWLTGAGIALFIFTLVAGNLILPQTRRLTPAMVGHDFLAFYTAGTFLNEGRSHDLYDLDKVKTFQHELARQEGLEIGASFGPFWNPPFYAWVFAPLARLPYHTALVSWEAINLAAAVCAMWLLMRLLRPAPRSVTGLVPLLLVISMPFIQALTHGQNTMISLLLLSIVVTFWRSGRGVAAGLVAGMLLYKPQLGALVAVALVVTLGVRAAIGLAITSMALLFVTLLTLPGTIQDYLGRMPGNLHQFQVENVYLWDRHVTLRAFWRLLLQGRVAGEMSTLAEFSWFASAGALVGLLGWTWWGCRRIQRYDAFIASVIVAMPLLMPFYFDYDLLLLAVPAVLYADLCFRQDNGPLALDRWNMRGWITLFFWLMVNSTVARYTRVNGSVILLSALAVMFALRAHRNKSHSTSIEADDDFGRASASGCYFDGGAAAPSGRLAPPPAPAAANF